MWWMLPILLLGFCLVHLCKMLRLYLVLMEHQIGFGKFIRLYFRTTFVNLIIPFKLGELYRFYSISAVTRVWQVGILSVFLDRFFDMVALILVLIPFDLMLHGGLTMVTFVLLIGIVVLAMIYLCIMPSYSYLNHYIICHKKSKRAMMALKALDVTKEWYDFTKNLITGRSALITLASLAGWIVELGVLKLFALYLNIAFGFGDFGEYIKAIFTGEANQLLKTYTNMGAVILLAATILSYMIYFVMLQKQAKVSE
jgi:hypothetical protein